QLPFAASMKARHAVVPLGAFAGPNRLGGQDLAHAFGACGQARMGIGGEPPLDGRELIGFAFQAALATAPICRGEAYSLRLQVSRYRGPFIQTLAGDDWRSDAAALRGLGARARSAARSFAPGEINFWEPRFRLIPI